MDDVTPRIVFKTHPPLVPGADLLLQASAAFAASAIALSDPANTPERNTFVARLKFKARQLFDEGQKWPGIYSEKLKESAKTYSSNNWQQYGFWAAAWLYRISGHDADKAVLF